jgi:hypothetical protein
MTQSFTEHLKYDRLTVVEVDKAAGRLRVRGVEDACSDLACEGTVVVTADGRTQDLEAINPGDIITMELKDGRARQITVVRRMYEEYSSPEL